MPARVPGRLRGSSSAEPAQGFERLNGPHVDAIDRARRQAQLAAGAMTRNHRVHEFRRADDRVDGAGGQTECAADAGLLIYSRHRLLHELLQALLRNLLQRWGRAAGGRAGHGAGQ